ncbi:IcmF-related protein [hydrothermal vent metagenome]|uniref:IcmF-related protein n=1 Tax=hydrothermal vent metagenome TaxID=652676 RepID=A0A1W1BCI6_9ZZZZ
MSSKPFYKTWSFWLLFITFLLAIGFLFLGKPLYEDFNQRAIYSSIFFVSILIINLLYLLFSKEENRAKREKKIESFWAKRREKKIQKAEEQKLATALREKFNRAKDVIRDASIYESISYQNYELPWYLVIGEEQSKKASILRNSGLDFPVNINYKDSEYNDNRDDMSSFRWFFAEESVFINVPSAYVSTDKDRLERVVWNEFLRLFKKERWRKPVNGIILTVNIEKFYTDSEEELREYAKVLRARFDELSKAFFSKIPIYVIISGLESVDGFYEYFNTLTDEEKREILGVTFDENLVNINENTIATKFSLLQRRLESDRIDKLYREFDVDSRAKAYFFDEKLRELIEKITKFNSQLFSKTRFHAPLMLRGIYFTSVNNQLLKGIFLPRVFDKIILSESNLVKIDKNFKRKYTILQWILVALLSAIVFSSAYYWLSFLNKESSEVPKVQNKVDKYRALVDASIADIELVKSSQHIKTPNRKRAKELGMLGGSDDGSVSFKPNKSELTASAKESLIDVISKIRENNIKKIKIIGHTDSDGSFEANKKLSLERAKSVKRFFVSYGIERDTISTFGKGESKPLADNSTKEGKAINRRVEIIDDSNNIETSSKTESPKQTEQKWGNIIKALDLLCLDAKCERDISSDFWKPGYYKVAQRDESIRGLYHKTLNLLLLNAVAFSIERELLDNLDDGARTTYNLKAYLLLANQEKRDENPEFLQEYMLERWGEIEPKDISTLNNHFAKLLSTEMSDIKLNEMSIKKARSAILANSNKIKFYYNRMMSIIAKTKDLNSFQFKDEVLSDELEDGSYIISGIYTKNGYRKVMVKESRLILKSVIKDNWILGRTKEYSTLEFEKIYKKVLRLYFHDYTKEWDMALSKISIAKHYDSDALAGQLSDFSNTESPVVQIIRSLKKNTYLLTTQERVKESQNALTGKITNVADKLTTLKKDADEKYKLQMRGYYKEYYRLVDKEGLPSSKLKAINKKLKIVYQEMLSADNPTGTVSDKLKKDLWIKFKKLPIIVGDWYRDILDQNWRKLDEGIKSHLKKEYKEVYKEYSKNIANKFPLNPQSKKDVDINDFVDFFKKDGIWDSYYKAHKEEISHNSSIKVSKKIENSMSKVKKIRELLFNGNGTGLEITFDIEPITLNPNYLSMSLEYKSQSLNYEVNGTKELSRFILSENDNPLSAKFRLKDLDSETIVEIEGKGRWALLKLLYKLHPKRRRNGVVIISSSGNSLIVKGKSANLLLNSNLLQKFKLKP